MPPVLPRLKTTPFGDTDAFTPSPERPVRVRSRSLPADAHLEPHCHAWGQLTYCETGTMQVTCSAPHPITCMVPPSRAVWVPPHALHSVTVIEAAQLRTLYVCASAVPFGWTASRVIRVSPLLRELIGAMDSRQPAFPAAPPAHNGPAARPTREQAVTALLLDAPTTRSTLADWARDTGASERTMARLFREELGMSYPQWRQQVVLAHALPLLARGLPISQVAAASGYASDSAFTAMFKAAMGQPNSCGPTARRR